MKYLQIILIITSYAFADLSVELIAKDFDKPIYVLSMPYDNNTLLVVEQKGVIQLFSNGRTSKTPFLDIRDRVHNPLFPGDESGLLGFAFDPDFNNNGIFYVNYVNENEQTIISRFKTNGKLSSGDSEYVLLTLDQPYSNHNGGCMEFGKDGYLYISVGDGGSSGDPEKRAQNLDNLFGTILRIDVNTDKGYKIPSDNPFLNNKIAKDEIWSYGLRNVWRFSFDALTGDMIMGDVGQHLWEEINFETSNSVGGINYGWNVFEGNHCYPEDSSCVDDGYMMPIFEYPNNANYARTLLGFKQKANMDGCSITGGYVYRGTNIKSLYGRYIFGDYCTGKVWSLKINNGIADDVIDHTSTILESMGKREFYLSSFGQDNNNELLLIDYTGSIYRLKEAE